MSRSVLLIMACAACLVGAEPACVVDFPVYDATGNRLDFKVTRVSPVDDDSLNLLQMQLPKPYGTAVTGSRVAFILPDPREIMGRAVVVTLANSDGVTLTTRGVIMRCPQRMSVRYGEAEALGDLAWVTATGRATGCRFEGDWWVRAMPMFGTSLGAWVAEGQIGADGSFTISGGMKGERHIVVLGKGKQPVRAVGIDITVGGTNNIGTVDLSDFCPEE